MPSNRSRTTDPRWLHILNVLLVFAIPWQRALIVLDTLAVGTVIAGVALLGGVYASLTRRYGFDRHLIYVVPAMLWFWTTLTLLWTRPESWNVGFSVAATLMTAIGVFYLVSADAKAHGFEALVAAYVAGCFVASAIVVLRFIGGEESSRARYTLTEDASVNAIAFTIALGLPLALWLAREGLRTWRILGLATLPLSIYAVFLSGSRGSIVSLTFAAVSFAFLGSPGARLRTIIVVISGVFVPSAVLFSLVPAETGSRFLQTLYLIRTGDFSGRGWRWVYTWDRVADSPLIGSGLGTARGDQVSGFPSPHNTYLQTLFETGAVGFGLLVLFFVAVAWLVVRLPVDRRPYAGSLVILLFVGLSSRDQLHGVAVWCVLSIVLALRHRGMTNQSATSIFRSPTSHVENATQVQGVLAARDA